MSIIDKIKAALGIVAPSQSSGPPLAYESYAPQAGGQTGPTVYNPFRQPGFQTAPRPGLVQYGWGFAASIPSWTHLTPHPDPVKAQIEADRSRRPGLPGLPMEAGYGTVLYSLEAPQIYIKAPPVRPTMSGPTNPIPRPVATN